MKNNQWWTNCPDEIKKQTSTIWVPLGNPGYAGETKQDRKKMLDKYLGVDGWQMNHLVRGEPVPVEQAIREYEHSYRVYLKSHPDIVSFLIENFGNVYDFAPENVYDDSYIQPHTERNHYQDISIRRVIAELVLDPSWTNVQSTSTEVAQLTDLADGTCYELPRAVGFRGDYLLEVRGLQSAGYFLNPAVIPFYDPSLIVSNPQARSWYLEEGCRYWSIEAFWQYSKILTARYDRYASLDSEGREAIDRLVSNNG